jgi:cysteine-rich repeat protein
MIKELPALMLMTCLLTGCPTGTVISTCGDGTFFDVSDCRPCSAACGAGRYQVEDCGGSEDRECAACPAVPGCTSAITCTGASDSQCTSCAPGFFLVEGVADTCRPCSPPCGGGLHEITACGGTSDRVCSICAPVVGCTSAVTCTTGSDSQCTSCEAGLFLVEGVTDTCSPCSPACPPGMFESTACAGASDRACTACTPVAGCDSAITCTSGLDSQCTACGTGFFLIDGMADTCSACSPACGAGQFESTPCAGTGDRACTACTPISSCTSAITCTNPADSQCTSCAGGFTLVEGPADQCVSSCGNGTIDGGETCDDGNTAGGDGCSPACQIEPGWYCWGAITSTCRPGGCIGDPLTALPLGGAFAIDGGPPTADASGLTFGSSRGHIRTSTDVRYPVMVEVDVTYSNTELSFIGTRGSGLRDGSASNEPGNSVWGRLHNCCANQFDIATAPGITAIATQSGNPISSGPTFRMRWVDDGFNVRIEWYDLASPAALTVVGAATSFLGGGHRAFIGGGGSSGTGERFRNLRVCSAPPLPVTSGLAARYDARQSWTVVRDGANNVSVWQDTSGNSGRDLAVNGASPVFAPALLGGEPTLDFGGGKRLTSAPFPLTSDVTVFVVMQQRTPGQWGAIAHHGNRDVDWSLEQSGGDFPDTNIQHWQSVNDNTGAELTLVTGTSYVLTGRMSGMGRYFSSTTLDGTLQSTTATGNSIVTGSKPLFVGASDVPEFSNAYISEIVYFDRALNQVERDDVIEYLRSMWR